MVQDTCKRQVWMVDDGSSLPSKVAPRNALLAPATAPVGRPSLGAAPVKQYVMGRLPRRRLSGVEADGVVDAANPAPSPSVRRFVEMAMQRKIGFRRFDHPPAEIHLQGVVSHR